MSDIAPAAAKPLFSHPLWQEVIETCKTVLIALAIALVLRVALFQPFTIPSSSMEPGLVTGDYIVVSKYAYGWSRASFPLNPPLFEGRRLGRGPARGDVVVFRLPRDPGEVWVKRVIGLPGDRVQVLGAKVWVNGRPFQQTVLESAQDHDDPSRTVPLVRETQPDGRSHLTYGGAADHAGAQTGVYVVPEHSYFMMGDNRDNSLDSRWPREVGVGFLPEQNIIGRAELVLVSWKPGAALTKPWTWLNLQLDRLLRPIR